MLKKAKNHCQIHGNKQIQLAMKQLLNAKKNSHNKSQKC